MLQATLKNSLGDVSVTIPSTATVSETQAVVDALNAQNARIFKVTIISTVVVGMAALINSYRMLKQLKRDEILLKRKLAR
jgi:anaerobic C4-dicarboxylate transporter